MQLQSELDAIKAAKIQIVGVSYDPVETLKDFSEKANITFPLLSDTDSKTIDAYKLRNTKGKPGTRTDGIPHPGTIIVNPEGRVVAKLMGTVIRRHKAQQLIEAVQEIQ